MLYAGAANDTATATQMEQVLHLGTEPGIHKSFEALIDSLVSAEAKFDLQLANAIWPQIGYPVADEFVDVVSDQYGGITQELDFSDPESRTTINEWVEDNTNGQIQELLESLSPNTVLLLTPAGIYAQRHDIGLRFSRARCI